MKAFAEQMSDLLLNLVGVVAFKRILSGLIAGGFFYQLAVYLERSLCG